MLTKEQKQVLEIIFDSKLRKTATWGGGTALSEIYLKHRQSEDIDIILSDLPSEIELTAISNKIKKDTSALHKKSFTTMNRFQYVFDLRQNRQIKLEFVYFPFIKLNKPRKIGKIAVESLKDLAVSKILSAYQRNEVKDAVDVYFILKRKKFTLKELVSGVEKKFGEEIDVAHLLARLTQNLTNFSFVMPLLYQKISKSQIKELFQKEFDYFLKTQKL